MYAARRAHAMTSSKCLSTADWPSSLPYERSPATSTNAGLSSAICIWVGPTRLKLSESPTSASKSKRYRALGTVEKTWSRPPPIE